MTWSGMFVTPTKTREYAHNSGQSKYINPTIGRLSFSLTNLYMGRLLPSMLRSDCQSGLKFCAYPIVLSKSEQQKITEKSVSSFIHMWLEILFKSQKNWKFVCLTALIGFWLAF